MSAGDGLLLWPWVKYAVGTSLNILIASDKSVHDSANLIKSQVLGRKI